jgi:hypothetical protein
VRQEKTKTVILMGAGTSKESGVPLMVEFLDVAYNLRRYTDARLDKAAFDTVFNSINELQGVYAKSNLELTNVESVFATFEMAELFQKLGRLPAAEVANLGKSMRRVIVETIELTQRFPRKPSGGVGLAKNYDSFVSKLGDLRKEQDVSLLSFNYDIGLDWALSSTGSGFSYGLSGTDEGMDLLYLKLHGSINWARCPDCGHVTPAPWEKVGIEDAADGMVNLRVVPFCLSHLHCQQTCEVAIVPPTWNKAQHYRQISHVWRLAARRLQEAENIIVLGYSLPSTDQFFHHLFALGTMGDARLQHFWVFNPDPEVDGRYRKLLGPVAEKRYQLFSGEYGKFRNIFSKLGFLKKKD